MFRVLTALVLVSACSPSGVVKSGATRPPEAPASPKRSPVIASGPTAKNASVRRLAPPFGGSSGVRRVSEPSEASPTVVAAVERHD